MSFNSTRALEMVKYFTEDIDDPFNLIPVMLITLCFAWCGFPSGKHKVLAWWALFNGCIIHCWMEVFIGTFARGPKWMVVGYGKLDVRYWPTKDPMVMGIVALELCIMGPLCILWYRSIVKDLWWRHFVSVLVSAIQMTGTILFAGVEAYDGFKHVPVDWPPKFDTFDKIFYFWIFFVLANGLWIFAPVTIMLQTLLEMKDVYNPANSSGKKCN
ncbi:probable 3-beta-hydroxysteroid-Delta(8),Delta(7)-isomerase [Acropora muricata]|uniref:probable 3-beta-hydroxysteroid-Delta(8),Delta(7)-isomerase n=1 Tax=Acropora muricata TaxID=159855 RepID=UPI0034E4496D